MKKKNEPQNRKTESFFIKLKKDYTLSGPALSPDASERILRRLKNPDSPRTEKNFYYKTAAVAAALILTLIPLMIAVRGGFEGIAFYSCRTGFTDPAGKTVQDSEVSLNKGDSLVLLYKKGVMTLSGPGAYTLSECGMNVRITFGRIHIRSEGSIPENRLRWKTRNTEYVMTGTDAHLSVSVTEEEHLSVKEGSFRAAIKDPDSGDIRSIELKAGESLTSDPSSGEILLGKYQELLHEPFNPLRKYSDIINRSRQMYYQDLCRFTKDDPEMEIHLRNGRTLNGRIRITVKESCILNSATGKTEIIPASSVESIRPL